MLHQNSHFYQNDKQDSSSSESRSAYRDVYQSIAQNDRIEYGINQLDRTVRKVFERLLKNSARQHLTVFSCRWLIDRITASPYSRWLSRIVDRLLVAIENHGGQDNV